MEIKFRKLKANEIDCRVSQIQSNWLTLLLYKDARVDMDILDETVGCMNWKREHLRENANCRVSIYNTDINEWVSKEDTGTESFSEAEKGLASDSFKRACVNWGIGRELYTSPFILILPNKDMIPKGQESEFYKNSKDKYETKTRFWVEYIDYSEDNEINNIIIRDNKNHVRFSQLKASKEEELLKLEETLTKLIEKLENTKDFDREKFYKSFKVNSINEMLIKDKERAIELLKVELDG